MVLHYEKCEFIAFIAAIEVFKARRNEMEKSNQANQKLTQADWDKAQADRLARWLRDGHAASERSRSGGASQGYQGRGLMTTRERFWKLLPVFILLDAPATCFPQIWRMFETGSSRDVSLICWAMCGTSSILWALQGSRLQCSGDCSISTEVTR
jgi:hypothetical protein